MNIFVASWFFPPATSSEGIVTYKLLRNSKNQYDVFSSTSKQWGYDAFLRQNDEKNILCYTVETDNIDEWVQASIRKFEELYPKRKYDCLMTRSTPPESILIGLQIKQLHPEIKWIASLGDPVANNPYELKAYIDDCNTLNNAEKNQLRAALLSKDEEELVPWEKRPEDGVQLLCKLKRWENAAIAHADLIIAPTATQLKYMLQTRPWSTKYFALPHSFDESFYGGEVHEIKAGKRKVVFSFIGYSDNVRSLEPFVRAVLRLKEKRSPFLDRLEIRFIGNNPRSIQDLVLNYFLDDIIHFEGGVDYYRSLELMQDSDWLLHVDGFFPQLTTGGSIFFAGKLADYMGARRPIFALTGTGSPAYNIVNKAGGVCLLPWDITGIAEKLEEILCGEDTPINEKYINTYAAPFVSQCFDSRIDELCGREFSLRMTDWTLPPQVENRTGEKMVTICVPSYNVERYLERCLKTLVSHNWAQYVEVLVIDDGSIDHTAYIGKQFEQHYPSIVRVVSKKNGGHGSTINRAIAEGTGRYFMVVDGDDWIDSKEFAKVVAGIYEERLCADIISSNYHEINMETGVLFPKKQDDVVTYDKLIQFDDLDIENTYFTLASSLIRLDVLRKVNKPLQEHTFYVDVEYILFPIPFLKTVQFVDRWIYKYCRGNEEQSVYLPTMVKRYDHHERVMKRVLDYELSIPMTDAQHEYYDAILKRLLITHYALCLVYDDDKQRGFSRAAKFDEYLKESHPALAHWIGKEMKQVRVARRYGFDEKRVERSLILGLRRGVQKVKAKVVHSRFLHRLVYNRFTLRLSKMNAFSTPFGKRIKNRLKTIIR